MLISIIINNFNYDKYLSACIDSCLSQDYKNKEIIVVDDGSYDKSRNIINSYGVLVHAIFKPNGGQGSALNSGFFASSGEVVIFLDSDDTLAPDCLSSIYKIWRSHLSKVHFNLGLIDEDGLSLGENYCSRPLPRGDLTSLILNEANYVSTPSSGNAFSRTFLEKVMPMPEAEWRGAADGYLFNLAPLFGEIGAIDIAMGFYRMHDRNLSSHMIDSRFNIDKCRASIAREIKTEKLIADFSRELGYKFRLGALTNSYSHLQLKMIHDKLAKQVNAPRFSSAARSFIKMSRCILDFRGAVLFKIGLIHIFMLFILLLPSRLAERLVIFGYQKGAVLFVRRAPPKRTPCSDI